MLTEYTKKDATTLTVSKPVETTTETQDYKLDYLKKQELSILEDLNNYVAKRKEELTEVRALISEAEKLGIKTEDEVKLEEETLKEETTVIE